ncbi:MAG: hypothetical protein AB1631_23325, partial [Acidobacteriota bacterium]
QSKQQACFPSGSPKWVDECSAAVEKSLLSFARSQTPPLIKEDDLKLMEEDKLKSPWLSEKLKLVRGLFRCAAAAVENPDFKQNDIERIVDEIFGGKTESSRHRNWMWGCARTFLNAHARGRKVTTHVALVNTSKKEGYLAKFEVELIEGGNWIFHHPADWIAGYFDEEFLSSIEMAWQEARNLAESEGASLDYSARWRLVAGGAPLSSVQGRSASGAAGLAFYHALKSTVPDDEIIVLAQFDKQRNLEGVDSVMEKTRAIAASDRIDKIVVATRSNSDEAESVLKECGKLGSIKVELNDGE